MVLVRPRNPLNIGAAARAMANFGLTHLTVVDPFEPNWRAARSAVEAEDLLESAVVAPSMEAAVAGCTLVLGTGSLTYRKPEQTVVALPALAPLVREEMARGGRIALVFGPEKHGLTREDLSWCHHLVEIPTGARQPSMNLGQAVAVCLYELATRALAAEAGSATEPTAAGDSKPGAAAPASADLDLLVGVIEETMMAARYSPGHMREANRYDLRLLLRRLDLSRHDLRRVLGLFRRIHWRLRAKPE